MKNNNSCLWVVIQNIVKIIKISPSVSNPPWKYHLNAFIRVVVMFFMHISPLKIKETAFLYPDGDL